MVRNLSCSSARAAWTSSARISSAGSRMSIESVSVSKVVSREIDFMPSRATTSLSSVPMDTCRSSTAPRPNVPISTWISHRASSPMVLIPCPKRAVSVFFPIPGIFLTGMGSRNAWTAAGSTTVSPPGFLKSDAIFATSFDGEIPIEQERPSRCCMVVLITPARDRASS